MLRDTDNLSFELMGENYFATLDARNDYDAEPQTEELEEFERDYTPAELAAAQERAWADDMKIFGSRRTTVIQPSVARLIAAGHSVREETAAINADAKRIRDIRLELTAEMNCLPAIEPPHASDCAHWVDEPCNCVFGKPDHYFEEAA